MSKALSESLFVEKSKFVKNIKFVCVRYGNVLNSRGSIIPKLHKIGQSENKKYFQITDEKMTRFIMTLEQSVNLIDHAIDKAESGDIVIPKLVSCNIKDLIEIFSELYNKPIKKCKLRPGEKMLESLINTTQSMRLIKDNNSDYMYIKPCFKDTISNCDYKDYNSNINTMTKFELKQYLAKLKFINLLPDEIINLQINPKLFKSTLPYPFQKFENILDESFARILQREILNIPENEWDRYDNPLERKFTLRDKENFPKNCMKLFNTLTSQNFLDHLTNIMGYTIKNDTTKNWWGIHKYKDGDYLDIHVDAGIHPKTHQKKQLTFGIYLSKNWKEENGGHLEIWEGDNSSNNNSKISSCKYKILPNFNTGIIFECNDYSWHGNPTPVKCANNEVRIFLTISYVSEQYIDLNKRQKAFFVKLPSEQENKEKDAIRLLRCDPNKYAEVYRTNLCNSVI